MTSKYAALTAYLDAQVDPDVDLSFAQLDRIVGGLPTSATKHVAWWANSRTAQSHARFWLDAGRRAQPDFARRRVRFTLGSETRYGPRAASERPQPAFERTGEQVRAAVRFEWLDAGSLSVVAGRISIPQLPSRPSVYRFTLTQADGSSTVYVGETDNLARRMNNYRTPGPTQPTNLRMNSRIRETITMGGTVRLAVAFEAMLNDERLDLASRPARLLAENAALLQLTAGEVATENL